LLRSLLINPSIDSFRRQGTHSRIQDHHERLEMRFNKCSILLNESAVAEMDGSKRAIEKRVNVDFTNNPLVKES